MRTNTGKRAELVLFTTKASGSVQRTWQVNGHERRCPGLRSRVEYRKAIVRAAIPRRCPRRLQVGTRWGRDRDWRVDVSLLTTSHSNPRYGTTSLSGHGFVAADRRAPTSTNSTRRRTTPRRPPAGEPQRRFRPDHAGTRVHACRTDVSGESTPLNHASAACRLRQGFTLMADEWSSGKRRPPRTKGCAMARDRTRRAVRRRAAARPSEAGREWTGRRGRRRLAAPRALRADGRTRRAPRLARRERHEHPVSSPAARRRARRSATRSRADS